MINSAAVKFDQIGQEDDVEMAEGTEETRFGSLAATLNYITVQQRGGDFGLHEPGQVGREIRCEEDVHEDGGSDTRKRLKKACMYRNGESDVGDDSLGTKRGDARRCPCGLRLGGTSRTGNQRAEA